MADDDFKIFVDGDAFSFDDFELGDLEWLEEYIGQPPTTMEALSSMKALVGMVFLIKRKVDESFTLEQARKVRMASLGEPAPAVVKKRPPKPAAR